MPGPDLVKTGIAGLDEILSGGIPRGNVILLEGAIGCGKTTLGVEFVYRGASHFDEPGVIVLFEVSPDKIIRDAQGFGWDLRELERTDRLRIVFTSREAATGRQRAARRGREDRRAAHFHRRRGPADRRQQQRHIRSALGVSCVHRGLAPREPDGGPGHRGFRV
jgi:chloramphenicol 3-O-phosphotransferase